MPTSSPRKDGLVMLDDFDTAIQCEEIYVEDGLESPNDGRCVEEGDLDEETLPF